MSEDKKSLINLVPNSIDNAINNIIDKPTQNIGTTLADIWYLVFGGISQAAEKRKLKYSYALQEFEEELKEKISKIPEDKLVEPDIQIIAPILEASKYCVEKETLRNLFSSLITSSINIDFNSIMHPSYIEILKHLSNFDAKLLVMIYQKDASSFTNLIEKNINNFYAFIKYLSISFCNLENFGLICYNTDNLHIKFSDKKNFFDYNHLLEVIRDVLYFEKEHTRNEMNGYYIFQQTYDSVFSKFFGKVERLEDNLFFVNMTPIGKNFMSCCFSKQ